jgi:hypothetical protein
MKCETCGTPLPSSQVLPGDLVQLISDVPTSFIGLVTKVLWDATVVVSVLKDRSQIQQRWMRNEYNRIEGYIHIESRS